MDGRPAGPPPHLRAGLIALVALGGALGTAVRAVLAAVLPPVDGISWTILAINVAGAFCLGLLLEHLALTGPDVGRRRTVRLFVGTGVLGGFTTYSALADDTARLIDVGRWGAGAGSALLTVLLGLAAVVAGTALAAGLRRRATASAGPGTGPAR
ncbi:CrcB family protein [Curtobacterium sp. MCJR17_055]|uniref:fluoride efflux transporter FluC n=1 Tax=unclassified Curtobacterium TaxID=257496 RepID=UPI000D9B56D4|nr:MULTISPECIES: CrcB family protein [unclassified Curtobacterium]PYY35329.1 CrcB family protein [Curtobacterium sp. MCBD17_029]PYY55387.1 CrcB family protein [Curtobacterium sp. MCJR17_055]PYY55811.1 CrcB family protein [Curtobacterium sp. MCPF17_015]WIB35215.1 CrcB family protein [Curtobacterium sp. MCJR17_043]